MPAITQLTDEDLLRSDGAEEFGVFYDRHVRSILGYFARRTGNPEVAADLTAETFASAIVAKRRFRPGGALAAAWLFTIASRRLADCHRHGHARRALGGARRERAGHELPGDPDRPGRRPSDRQRGS